MRECDNLSSNLISVIVRKKFRMNLCLFVNGYWGRAVWIYGYKNIVNGNEEGEIIVIFILNI